MNQIRVLVLICNNSEQSQMDIYENVKEGVKSIKANKLRTFLTAMIIAIGIMSLVGILTAIESIKSSITKEFTFMGANTFSISSRGMRVQVGNKRYRTKNHSYISFYQAKEFKELYDFPATAAISVYGFECKIIFPERFRFV